MLRVSVSALYLPLNLRCKVVSSSRVTLTSSISPERMYMLVNERKASSQGFAIQRLPRRSLVGQQNPRCQAECKS